MLTIMLKRLRAYCAQRVYLLLGIGFLLLSLTLTAKAILTVSSGGLSGDADVTVDGSGTLNLGTASSTGVTIGKTGIPVTIPGTLAVNGTLSLGSASTTAGQLFFNNTANGFTTLLQASSSQASNLTFTMPPTTGTAGQALLTDGTGTLYFGSAGSSQWVTGDNGSISYDGGNVTIGATLPGASAGGTVGSWNKYTVSYTNAAFQAAATAVSVALGELPANGVVEAIRIKHSTAFAGPDVAAVSCSLGDGTNDTAYAGVFDVFQAVSNTAQQWDGGAYSTTAAAHNLTLRCTANVNFGNGVATVLTAGSVTVWIKAGVLQ